MDDTIITNPNEIMLVKVNKTHGFYAYVVDVEADIKPGWWQIKMCPLIPTADFKLPEVIWKLDSNQIRGLEFTMNDIPHQLFKVDFPKTDKNDSETGQKSVEQKKEIPSHLKLVK